MSGIQNSKPNIAPDAIRMSGALPEQSHSNPAFAEIHTDLLAATSKGRGNSEWLSFGDARRILNAADDAGPQVAGQLRTVLTDALKSGKVADNNLILGGRALKLLSEFTGTDPSVYLAIAGDKAQAAQVASAKASGLHSHSGASTFERNTPAARTASSLTTSTSGAWSGVLSTFAGGLKSLADSDSANNE